MEDCETAITPMNANEKLQRDDGTGKADEKHYRSIVGGLNYLTHTRPDIAYSVSVVSRFLHSPTKQHFGAAKRILRYIAGTVEKGVWYETSENFRLVGYIDSDWVGSLDDRKSTSGSIFTLGSGAITWSSKKQDTIALSSNEAEYVASGAAGRQAIWLRKLLADLGNEQRQATVLWCDNKFAIAMTKNPAYHARTKHIEIQHHFIRGLVSEGKVELKFCGTTDQNADLFTKSLTQAKHQMFMKRIGVCSI
ncbi:secreted RxLR effector protein 161-like [Silene latifolia]|uniref:secreted RxLR effector protein 161-like n=1 Tax=Silene latifolia TaxID=37657 RepID=UPI003D770E99